MFSIFRDHSIMAPVMSAWEHGDDCLRAAILSAMQEIDEQLKEKPNRRGESRPDGTRILFKAPLGLTFEVDDERKLVIIRRAWVIVPRPQPRDHAA